MSLMSVAVRRAASGGIDKPAAAVAALVAGAAVFLMPGGILEPAVLASGLPDTFQQLTPPLGMKSRAGLALLAAGSAFGMVLMMMRVLAFFTKRRDGAQAAPADAPRLRRRDRHPDAPVRTPLSASRDLGEPADDFQPEPVRVIRREAEPELPEPPRLRVKSPSTRRRAPLLEVLGGNLPEERAEAVPVPQPEEPQPQPQPEPGPEPEPEPEPAPEPEAVAEAAAPEPAEITGRESLPELLARFERALERKGVLAPASELPAEQDEDEAGAEEGMDLRLRSALENLRRFAPRRG
jgi:hypothetical protein